MHALHAIHVPPGLRPRLVSERAQRVMSGAVTDNSQPGAGAAEHEPTDAELIAAAVRDPHAFMPLVQRHHRVLYGYLARRIGADLAEELTSETFARAFAQREKFDPRWDDARPWLFGIALNLMRSHLRSESRRHRAYTRVGNMDSATVGFDESDIDTRLDATAHGPALTQALEALAPVDRETLLLFAWGDMSYEDIAATLDIPVGTVRSRLNRARRVVREALESSAGQQSLTIRPLSSDSSSMPETADD